MTEGLLSVTTVAGEVGVHVPVDETVYMEMVLLMLLAT